MLSTGAAGIAVLLAAGVPSSTLHVPLRQTLSFDHPGATVAYVVDPTVADASASDGRVTLFGRGAGSTNLTVVSDTGFADYEVVVDAPPPRLLAGPGREANRHTAWEALYDSTSGRIRSAFGARSRGNGRTVSADLVTLTQVGGGDDGYATNLVPAASVRLSTPGRELVLFDALVAESPLAFDGIPLRGGHLRQGALAVHGGYTSSMLYQGLLLPTDRESAFGASYRLPFGGGGLVPSLYWFSGSSEQDAARGATASVLYERGHEETGLHFSSEVAYGGALGAGLEVTYQGESRHFRLAARHQPRRWLPSGPGGRAARSPTPPGTPTSDVASR